METHHIEKKSAQSAGFNSRSKQALTAQYWFNAALLCTHSLKGVDIRANCYHKHSLTRPRASQDSYIAVTGKRAILATGS